MGEEDIKVRCKCGFSYYWVGRVLHGESCNSIEKSWMEADWSQWWAVCCKQWNNDSELRRESRDLSRSYIEVKLSEQETSLNISYSQVLVHSWFFLLENWSVSSPGRPAETTAQSLQQGSCPRRIPQHCPVLSCDCSFCSRVSLFRNKL